MNKDFLNDDERNKYELRNNDNYLYFLESLQITFNENLSQMTNKVLFKTDIHDCDNLFNLFLYNLPIDLQQFYNCNCCRHFINKYGSLVFIDNNYNLKSAFFNVNNTPSLFKKSISILQNYIETSSHINTMFYSDIKTLGIPQTGIWQHMSITLPNNMLNKNRLKNANQMMTEKREDFNTLKNALDLYDVNIINKVIDLLNSETLYRADACIKIANWFKEVVEKNKSIKKVNKNNHMLWIKVATAPNGYCHIKNNMIGTLLDDFKNNYPVRTIINRYNEKMNPSNYMRSQSAPTQNTIMQAEKLINQLGLKTALQRRYARLDEIPFYVWKNFNQETKKKSTSTGVFSNITPKQKVSDTSNNLIIPQTTMTWSKFSKTILPNAIDLQIKTDNPNRFMALVTANDKDAENILQWDNTFSWYYHGGIDSEIKQRVEQAGGQYENTFIRCSLLWNNRTDLDIHCITPNKSHIYYGNKRDNGGYLDVDMNVNGETDKPVENIRWFNTIPSGHYKFFVHNYTDRGHCYNPYKVELSIGDKIYTVNGVLGKQGDKQTVFEFDYYGEFKNIKMLNNVENSCDISNVLTQWNVENNSFVKVNCITTSPNLWGKNNFIKNGSHLFFLLDGCKDNSEGKGRGFFNEMLTPELKEIRKTLEAYTQCTPIEDIENATACGVGYSKDMDEWNLILKVTTNSSTRLIKIDRFD